MWTLVAFVVALIVSRVDWAALRRGPLVALGILAVVTTLDTGSQGRFLWSSPLANAMRDSGVEPQPGKAMVGQAWEIAKRRANYYRLVSEYFTLDRVSGRIGLTDGGLSSALTPNFDYDSYTQFYRHSEGSRDLRDRLMGARKVYLHASLDDNLTNFFKDVSAYESAGGGQVAVDSYDGNELRLTVTSQEPAYVSWIDNVDAGWSAGVDGKPARIERLLGTFKAVRLDAPGAHHVVFRYSPVISTGAYAGSVVGVLALAALLALARVVGRRSREGSVERAGDGFWAKLRS
jgi:hypothetical protein